MENITQYIHTELLVLIPALWGVGMAVKKSRIENRFIPLILFTVSVASSALKIFADCEFTGAQAVSGGVFARLTQGSIVFFCAWYGYEKYLHKSDGETATALQTDNRQIANLLDYDGTMRGQEHYED